MKTSIIYGKPIGLLLMTIVLFLTLFRVASAQNISGDGFVCQDDIRDYTFTTTKGCSVLWTVTEGVFSDDNNSTSVTKMADNSGVVKIRVKWTGQGIGNLFLAACDYTPNMTVFIDAIPFTVKATPSTIYLGADVLLTAEPSVPIYPTYAWTGTPAAVVNLQGTTGGAVSAMPTATSVYSCQASYTFTTGVTQHTCTKTKTVTVTVNVPPFTGNTICCSQCITPSQTPAGLGQAPGTVVGGGNGTPYKYQWLKSTDGIGFDNISGQTGLSYSPGALFQTTWYARTVSATGLPIAWSNIIRIDAPPPTLSAGAATYSKNVVRSARETIAILGNQEPAEGVQVEFRAGEQIIVQSPSILYSGVILYAGFTCDAAARMGSRSAEVAEAEEPMLQEESASTLSVYPNPSSGGATIHYAVPKAGYARVSIANSQGIPLLTLAEEQDAAAGEYDIVFDTHTLRPGLYFCIVQTADGQEVKRISVQSN